MHEENETSNQVCVSDIFKMKQATKCGVSDIF